jgi:hypothetical protein
MSLDAETEGREISRETIMKRRAQVLDGEALASEIASLSKPGIDELRERWKAMFGKAPSRDIARSFLTRAIAYRPGKGFRRTQALDPTPAGRVR